MSAASSIESAAAEPAANSPEPVSNGENLDRMVRALAGRVLASIPRDSGIELADLVQAGNIGLLQAIRTFSPEHGAPLAGYAKFRIRGEMLDTVRRYRSRRESTWTAVSFHGKGTDSENLIEDKVPAPVTDSPDGVLSSRQRAAILGQEIEKLPPRYRKVVHLRYSRECSLREIGAALRVQESRACQIHRSALDRLRRALRNRGVREMSQLI